MDDQLPSSAVKCHNRCLIIIFQLFLAIKDQLHLAVAIDPEFKLDFLLQVKVKDISCLLFDKHKGLLDLHAIHKG